LGDGSAKHQQYVGAKQIREAWTGYWKFDPNARLDLISFKSGRVRSVGTMLME